MKAKGGGMDGLLKILLLSMLFLCFSTLNAPLAFDLVAAP